VDVVPRERKKERKRERRWLVHHWLSNFGGLLPEGKKLKNARPGMPEKVRLQSSILILYVPCLPTALTCLRTPLNPGLAMENTQCFSSVRIYCG